MSLDDAIDEAIETAVRAVEMRAGGPTQALPASVRLAGALDGDVMATTRFVQVLRDALVRALASARVAVTGQHWIGGTVGSVESAALNLITEAEREILWSIYSLGAEPRELFDALEERLVAGVRFAAVVNDLAAQPAWATGRLDGWTRRFPHCRVRSFSSTRGGMLHAKVLIADRVAMLVGSANVSRGGLVGNHEMAVVVEGGMAEVAASCIDRLLAREVHDTP